MSRIKTKYRSGRVSVEKTIAGDGWLSTQRRIHGLVRVALRSFAQRIVVVRPQLDLYLTPPAIQLQKKREQPIPLYNIFPIALTARVDEHHGVFINT